MADRYERRHAADTPMRHPAGKVPRLRPEIAHFSICEPVTHSLHTYTRQ